LTKNLTAGPPVRLIVLFTVPLLIGNLFQQLYAVTDAAVVGRTLGVDALASVGASGSLQFLMFGFAIGASAGLAIPVARAFGAGDLAAMRRFVCAGILISAGIAVVIALAGTLGAPLLLSLMGTPAELMANAVTFLTVLFSGAVATVAFNFLSSVIRALGDSRTPLVFLVVACLLNAGLVALFITGFGLGIAGAAAATLVAQSLSVVLCLVLIRRRMPELRLRREDWRLRPGELAESARIGLAVGFQMSVIAIGAVVLQYGINQLGTQAVAAFTAAMRVDQVAVAPLASVGVAMTTYVAQNRGAGQWWRIRVGVFRISIVAAGLALALGLVIVTLGTDIVELFVGPGEAAVVGMAHRYLVINSSLYAVLAMLFLLRNAIQGLGSTGVPTVAGFMELVVRSAVGLFLVERIGFLGACLAAPLAWVGALLPVVVAWFVHRARLVRAEADAGLREGAAPVALELAEA
jgi:putative MATE family efflux protein